MSDIKKILLLSQKVLIHLERENIPRAKRELRRIIKLDLDELTRLQKIEGDKKLLEECTVIFKDAKRALMDLNSLQLFEEAKTLVSEIATLEGHELIEFQESEKKENQLYEFWHREIYSLKLYHYTSQINAQHLLMKGFKPGDKPVGWDILMEAWDLVDSIEWIPEGPQFYTILDFKENYLRTRKGLHVSPYKVYNPHAQTSESLYFFTKTLHEKVESMETVLRTGGNFESFVNIMERYRIKNKDYFQLLYQKIFTKPEQKKYVQLKRLLE